MTTPVELFQIGELLRALQDERTIMRQTTSLAARCDGIEIIMYQVFPEMSPFDDTSTQFLANPADDLPDTDTKSAFQHLVTMLCYPDAMIAMMETRMTSGIALKQFSLQDEGFKPFNEKSSDIFSVVLNPPLRKGTQH